MIVGMKPLAESLCNVGVVGGVRVTVLEEEVVLSSSQE